MSKSSNFPRRMILKLHNMKFFFNVGYTKPFKAVPFFQNFKAVYKCGNLSADKFAAAQYAA